MSIGETRGVGGGLRAVVYARVSTDAQERDGTSLDTQERACVERAELEGWAVARVIRDAASGASLDRPGVDVLRGMLRAGEVDVVVAYAVDRLARDQLKLAVLIDEVFESGARLEIVTEPFEQNAVGQFLMSARAFVAEVEREKIAERTQRGKGQRARSGRLPQATGRGIYGYHYDPASGTRAVDEVQATVVRRIFAEFAAGGSCHGIAQRLNAESVPAHAGGIWYAVGVRRLLLNETYTGRTVYRRTRVEKVRDPHTGRRRRRVTLRDASEHIEVPGATPRIIDDAIYERVQSILADPQRRARLARATTYMLSGRVRCAECGAAMVGQTIGRRERQYRYYRCTKGTSGPGESTCSSRYVRADQLEALVRDELCAVLAEPELLLREARSAATSNTAAARAGELRRQLDEVQAQQGRLADLYLAGSLDHAILDERARSLAQRADALRSEWQAAREAGGTTIDDVIAARLPDAVKAVRDHIREAAGEEFELLLTALDVRLVAARDHVLVSGTLPLADVDSVARFNLQPLRPRGAEMTDTGTADEEVQLGERVG